MAKKVGGFAQKHGRGREKREFTLVKYVKSVRSEKSGFYRFQDQILKINDGETVEAALKRTHRELNPEPEKIPVQQPETAAPNKAAKVEEKADEAIIEEPVAEAAIEEPVAEPEVAAEAVEPTKA
ncbi:MAG: hypothetical protein HQ528_01980 [Candidatus Marinimicrobia bacterium]|nr:hypothetical protein [Candidatus Neomarinimicrobiota bacterium]